MFYQIELTLYDIKDSSTGKLVSCDEEFCYEMYSGSLTGCMANVSCPYLELYGDGSSTAGYFVSDVVQYDRVSGDLQTTATNGSIIFGCVALLLFFFLNLYNCVRICISGTIQDIYLNAQ